MRTRANNREAPRWGLSTRASLVFAATLLVSGIAIASAPGSGQNLDERKSTALPFGAGEEIEFRVTSSRFGDMGTADMAVSGPTHVRGHDVLVLSMETRGRIFLVKYEDAARSWLDPELMASVRYEKEEGHALASRDESVEILLDEGRWINEDGEGGALETERPLDELSLIYFLRTLELAPGAVHTFHRHFDDARNPVRVRVLGRETITVPAGTFTAIPVEMRVRDERRYGEEGEKMIRLHFTDDARKVPLRIESSAPLVGTVTMTLRSASPPLGGSGEPPRSPLP